jgi:hypothetical protein
MPRTWIEPTAPPFSSSAQPIHNLTSSDLNEPRPSPSRAGFRGPLGDRVRRRGNRLRGHRPATPRTRTATSSPRIGYTVFSGARPGWSDESEARVRDPPTAPRPERPRLNLRTPFATERSSVQCPCRTGRWCELDDSTNRGGLEDTEVDEGKELREPSPAQARILARSETARSSSFEPSRACCEHEQEDGRNACATTRALTRARYPGKLKQVSTRFELAQRASSLCTTQRNIKKLAELSAERSSSQSIRGG